MTSSLYLAILVLLAVGTVHAARVLVWSPVQLETYFQMGVPHAVAPVGFTPRNVSLIVRVFRPEPNNACNPIKELPGNAHLQNPALIIDGGDCSLTTKVMNSIAASARLIIIIDENLEDVHNLEELEYLGAPNTYRIPILIIGKDTGNILTHSLSPDRPLELSINFNEKDSSELSFDLFLSSGDRNSYNFVSRLYKELTSTGLIQRVSVFPRYVSWDAMFCTHQNQACSPDDCLNEGHFCALDPDGKGLGTGRDVLWQHVVMRCLFEANKDAWWRYVPLFDETCFQKQRYDRDCYDPLLKNVGVDPEVVRKCFLTSFSNRPSADGPNKYIELDQKAYKKWGGLGYPTLINKQNHFSFDEKRGSLHQFICKELERSTQNIPDECKPNTGASPLSVSYTHLTLPTIYSV
eukprot:TRINITY_DN11440_c0_g1_i4.p1 TRINITY_DN11440_c0_g1~~TRINITY_DN11440_c0_g1_i4.p1  ORF type:complete len:407 (-),score=60.87 TRINITY_DN11440_c0_g1_i4:35-1255(-)